MAKYVATSTSDDRKSKSHVILKQSATRVRADFRRQRVLIFNLCHTEQGIMNSIQKTAKIKAWAADAQRIF